MQLIRKCMHVQVKFSLLSCASESKAALLKPLMKIRPRYPFLPHWLKPARPGWEIHPQCVQSAFSSEREGYRLYQVGLSDLCERIIKVLYPSKEMMLALCTLRRTSIMSVLMQMKQLTDYRKLLKIYYLLKRFIFKICLIFSQLYKSIHAKKKVQIILIP